MTKYILKAEKWEKSNLWEIVWYDDETGKIWKEDVEERKKKNLGVFGK
jgi:hypothetical protein